MPATHPRARVTTVPSPRSVFSRPAFRRLLSACLGLAGLLGAAVATPAAPVKFDIPAQPAADALMVFARQADVQVLFAYKELKAVHSPAVVGEFEPEEALKKLLENTGYTASAQDAKKFLVTKEPVRTGSIKGGLIWPDGAPAEGVRVFIRETGQSTPTDRYGQYVLAEVPTGTFLLIAQADGYQPLHLTDVTVKANSELILSNQTMRKADEVTKFEPYVVHAESVTTLDPYAVTGGKEKPFATANLDMWRTVNDVQPYYIFDTASISNSGAVNVEDFLKTRLTMNTQAMSNSQNTNLVYGGPSLINLRGLGTDATLILINGRRTPAVSFAGAFLQGDINGIPPEAVERIEVLPSSASAIYGGSALGGVVNIVLKPRYSGGRIAFSYENPLDTDAMRRSATLSYGLSLEGGRTNLSLMASASDGSSLVMQDRSFIEENVQRVLAASLSATSPTSVGTTPNIAAYSSLVLKDGTPLGSTYTYVPVGTAAGADASAGYLANKGTYNTQAYQGVWGYNGALNPVEWVPKVNSLGLSASRKMTPWMEIFADFNYSLNEARLLGPQYFTGSVSASVSTNPFLQTVTVTIPNNLGAKYPSVSRTTTHSGDLGMKLKLPKGWASEIDYSLAYNSFRFNAMSQDSAAFSAALASGALNPFVDTSLYSLDDQLEKFLYERDQLYRSKEMSIGVRAAGPLWELPWGTPQLMVGYEHAEQAIRDGHSTQLQANKIVNVYFGRASISDSGWTELTLPLITSKNALPFVRSFEVQAALRRDAFAVEAGTTYARYNYAVDPPTVTYSSTDLNGNPVSTVSHFSRTSPMIGFKWQPVRDVTLRASRSEAFVPPTLAQLAPNLIPSSYLTTINDAKTNSSYGVTTYTGGNPNLKPKTAESWNLGLIYEPHQLKGLRLNAEFYAIDQDNVITTLTAQQMVASEDLFPDRVVRDSTGKIVSVDLSNINANRYRTRGWDFSADYRWNSSLGHFTAHAGATWVMSEMRQITYGEPAVNYVGLVQENGPNKLKGSASLEWARGNWSAGWTATYFGSYITQGSPGTPLYVLYAKYGLVPPNLAAQGSPTIPSQIYHDAYVAYDFGHGTGRGGVVGAFLQGVKLQVGIKNVFNKEPVYDSGYAFSYTSAYGSLRMRSIWMRLSKSF